MYFSKTKRRRISRKKRSRKKSKNLVITSISRIPKKKYWKYYDPDEKLNYIVYAPENYKIRKHYSVYSEYGKNVVIMKSRYHKYENTKPVIHFTYDGIKYTQVKVKATKRKF